MKEVPWFLSKGALIEIQGKWIKVLEADMPVKTCDRKREKCEVKIKRFQYNLKLFRKRKGITQKEMSRGVGIDNAYISKLESGEKQNPSLKIIFRLSKYFDCPVSELLGE